MGYYSIKRKIPTEAGETLLDVARRIKAPVGFEYTPTASGSDTVNLSVSLKMPWFIAITALMAAVIYNVPLLVLRSYADHMTENAMKKEAE